VRLLLCFCSHRGSGRSTSTGSW